MREKLVKFFKYEGTGNDFIIIDGRESRLDDPLVVSKAVCDRHFSIGADDLLYLEKSDIADVKMRICEPDGSESSMCGNGIRCIASYLNETEVTIETLGGVKRVSKNGSAFTVNMDKMQVIGGFISPVSKEIIEERVYPLGKFFIASPGEPHAVTFVNDVEIININEALKVAQDFNNFPKGINVDFVELGESFIKVRAFERGIWGETLACGTGAVASSFLARRIFGFNDTVSVIMKGGTLSVDFQGDKAFLTGPAKFVFEGKVVIND